MISGVPGTVIAFVTALTGAITAYTNYQEQQAVSRATYEALKEATDRNTEQIAALNLELRRGREWTASIASAVKELQAKAPTPERATVPSQPPVTSALDEPAPPLQPLPSFDQLKKD